MTLPGESAQHLPSDHAARSLWMGDLAPWMEESFLFGLFQATGQVLGAKVIRNKVTHRSEGYGFIEFATTEAADAVLRTFNGCRITDTNQMFRLGRASFGNKGAAGILQDHSVFVGDLAPDVTDYVLQEHFRDFYPTVRSAKVITDPMTGRSKGYGFVRFGNEAERDRAMTEMMGHVIYNRPVRVSHATAKKTPTGVSTANASHPSDFDLNNTTLFIGGLNASIAEDGLQRLFGYFGDIIYVKIPPGKGCGFVQFVHRQDAERAMATMQAQVLGGSAIRISWGRSASASRLGPASVAAAAAAASLSAQLQSANFFASSNSAGGPALSPGPKHDALYGSYGMAGASQDGYPGYRVSPPPLPSDRPDTQQLTPSLLGRQKPLNGLHPLLSPAKSISQPLARSELPQDPLSISNMDHLEAAYMQQQQHGSLFSRALQS